MTFYLVQQWWWVPPAVPEELFVAPVWNDFHERQMSSGRPNLGPSGGSGNPTTSGRSNLGSDPPNLPQSHATSAGGAGENPAGSGAMSMGSVAAALPNLRSQAIPVAQNIQRVPASALPSMSNPQQQQHPLQFVGQTPQGPQSQQFVQSFPPQQAFMHSNYYMQPGAGQTSPGHPAGFQAQSYQSTAFYGVQPQQQQHSPPYMYYPHGYGQINPSQAYQGAVQSPGGMAVPGGGMPPGIATGVYGVSGSSGARRPGSVTGNQLSTSPSKGAIPSAPRGPPRKPKQSGHALWVGNLPPGAQVHELKDHFARDATKDIESVFLISKSNCAFVNYRTEPACAAAMTRFHDSRFKGVRLVCRYRSTATGSTSAASTGPAALASSSQQAQTAVEAIMQNREVSSKAEESMRNVDGGNKIDDKYFIVKSLTVEDLELSARNGIWATQAHNEEALNKAFESVESVYLIFSANKSGEYFGYAKMISPINEEWSSKLEWKPTQVVVDDPKLPRSIPTPATETAPRGRIIDDSARGTIFWEVESSESDEEEEAKAESPEKEEADISGEESPSPQAFGRPFKVEWISTNRLPFYRTRGLRNPWNANRDVKIARDGTELETSVGRRLIQMFHRAATPGPSQAMSAGSPPMSGGSMGYAAMPPF